MAIVAEVVAENERLKAVIERLVEVAVLLEVQRDALFAGYSEAVEDIADWAGYADDYFREKHDLEGLLAKHRATLASMQEKSYKW